MLADTNTLVASLHEKLLSCSKLIEAGDYSISEQSTVELINFLNSISDSLISEGHENEDSENIAVEILTRLRQYMSSSDVKQDIIDVLAFELPKVVAIFACVSTVCLEVAEDIIDLFVGRCSPRDMLPILCEAIGSPSELCMVPSYLIPLFSGLMKVIVLIQRRHYEHAESAVPVILNALKIVCSESDCEDTNYEKLFHKAAGIACSIRAVCVKLEGREYKKLNALLCLYVLQIMALVSVGMSSDISRCLPVVLELSDFLRDCELSYIGLLTGLEVDMIFKLVIGETREDFMDCFAQVKLGAALAVIWGYKASEVAVAAKSDMAAVLMELQCNWTSRWKAIGMLKYIFSCADLSWELKQQSIRFLICIMDDIVLLPRSDNEHVDYSMHMPTLYTNLQAIEMVFMYAPRSALRNNAFSAFKKMLADIPTSVRLDVLRALIINSDCSSMIGILVDCVKGEMHMGKIERGSSADDNTEVTHFTSFWNPSVLELVEGVLRPPMGGPPSLPENSDAVLSALNLFRFILIAESTGKSNYTGILSKDNLHKYYKEWLLPLCTLVTQTAAEIQKDYDQLACEMSCALNPIEFVLYRCIELVEENLKQL